MSEYHLKQTAMHRSKTHMLNSSPIPHGDERVRIANSITISSKPYKIQKNWAYIWYTFNPHSVELHSLPTNQNDCKNVVVQVRGRWNLIKTNRMQEKKEMENISYTSAEWKLLQPQHAACETLSVCFSSIKSTRSIVLSGTFHQSVWQTASLAHSLGFPCLRWGEVSK